MSFTETTAVNVWEMGLEVEGVQLVATKPVSVIDGDIPTQLLD